MIVPHQKVWYILLVAHGVAEAGTFQIGTKKLKKVKIMLYLILYSIIFL
jgi:hypothetical protein